VGEEKLEKKKKKWKGFNHNETNESWEKEIGEKVKRDPL
jgi:hypothetical protein